jgi:hypothetical protein
MTVGSKVKQTLADLKGAHDTLQLFSVKSRDKEAEAAFVRAIEITGEVIRDLEGRLRVLESEEPQYKGK